MGQPSIATAEPPPRPDAGAGTQPSRNGWATVVVVIAILLVVPGGYLVAGALSQPAGPPIGFRGVVSVRPVSGWAYAGRDVVAGAPFVRLTRGSGNLDVVAVVPYVSDAKTLALRYVNTVLSTQLSQLSVSKVLGTVRLRLGLMAVRFGYVGVRADTGTSIEGEVSVVVTPSDHGVVFDGWAPTGLLPFVRSDIETMVADATVG
jgi:hypothetical protein